MRLPLGSMDVSASGGTVELVGRRGEGWSPRSSAGLSAEDAVALIMTESSAAIHEGDGFAASVPSGSGEAPVFTPGEDILWRYGRFIETARVIRDDERGLVVWIPSGSARLDSVPADGRETRDVPLDERFSVARTTRESTWRGPGIARVAPTGRPWSVWFFRDADGMPQGVYVNLEVPHRRVGGAQPAVFTRDLVLDLWVAAEHPGSEDIWLKDADELKASIEQGRFTATQAEAVRVLGDQAAHEFILDGAWPLDEGWDRWTPTPEMDVPMEIPAIR